MKSNISKGILTICLPERIDTAVSSQVTDEINDICGQHPHTALVLDASEMTFISSSGLRIMLGLTKREQDFMITDVCDDVYHVFDMTGFTRIINVRRKMRTVSIEGCPVLGVGGVGTVYRLSEDTIIKVFREGTPLANVEREISLSKDSLVLGLPTAISFETVRVDNQYAIIHELINARTLASIISEDPSRTEYYGAMLGRMMRDNHSLKDESHTLPDAVSETHAKLDDIRRYFTDEQVDVLREIYDAIPPGNSVLHCDLHPKNVMVSNDELLLIDMGEVCCGNPLQDLSHTYSTMKGLVGDYKMITGLDEETSSRTFDSLLRAYFDTDDTAFLARKAEQIRVASLVRNFTWLSLSDSFPAALIEQCYQVYAERVYGHTDHIREVIRQFSEWG